MALEDLTGPAKFIGNLVAANPTPDDWEDEGDDHIRGIKNVLLNTFPRATGDVMKNLIGMVAAFMIVPARWIPMDGRTITEAAYPLLFAALGKTGTGNFTLPDTRGYFMRGFDPTGIHDAQAGRTIWSAQRPGIARHQHYFSDPGHTHTVPEGGTIGGQSQGYTTPGTNSKGGQTTALGYCAPGPNGVVVDINVTYGDVDIVLNDHRPYNIAVNYAIFADQ